MRKTRIVMGMPAAVELVGAKNDQPFEAVFALWDAYDERFSTYKETSETMRINRGEISPEHYSADMREVLALAERTKEESGGYFNARRPDGSLDPSGIVKGWAIQKAAELLMREGYGSFYLEIGGDIQTCGRGEQGEEWRVGVRNPFNRDEIVKVLYPHGHGVATSGTAARGAHIYNPLEPSRPIDDIASLTVLGPDICEADRFATAAFAMGRYGIVFIEELDGFEGYLIDAQGIATMTSGLDRFLA